MSGPSRAILNLIEQELEVDHVQNDVTVEGIWGGSDLSCRAIVSSKQKGVFVGAGIVSGFGEILGRKGMTTIACLQRDGEAIQPGENLVELEGSRKECLAVERTLLNFLAHLCGIATLTHQFVEKVKPHPTKILCTRKTLPGLRELQLIAIVAGGGHIHRRSLSDGILIKDNHLSFISPGEAVSGAKRRRSPLHCVEVEIDQIELLDGVLRDPPDVIMLDNMDLPMLKTALAKIDRRCAVEVSGGVDLAGVKQIAELGVDYISVGRITHSAPALDLTMDVMGWPES